MLPNVIETFRLKMRHPRLSDAQSVFEHWGADAKVMRYMSFDTFTSIKDAKAYIQKELDKFTEGKAQTWFITKIDDDVPIGFFKLRYSECSAELSCALNHSEWGKGYMFELGKTLVDMVFTELPHLSRVDALCCTENLAPARMMEKCGAQMEGMLRKSYPMPNLGHQPFDFYIYAVLRDDWKRLNAYPNALLRRYSE